MDIREKIARAIVEVLEANGEIVVMDHRLIADAVLDAMREPTVKMGMAANAALNNYDTDAGPEEILVAWQAMIDAAK